VDKEGDKVRALLMAQRGPRATLAAYQLAADHKDPSALRGPTLAFAGAYLNAGGERAAERERFLDSGMLDAIRYVQGGGRLTEDQQRVLDQRWKHYGTPLGNQINKMYETSDLRWDR
jgi:hypothetical protein